MIIALLVLLSIIIIWHYGIKSVIPLLLALGISSIHVYNISGGSYFKLQGHNLECIENLGEPNTDNWNVYGTKAKCELDKPLALDTHIDDMVSRLQNLKELDIGEVLYVMNVLATPARIINNQPFDIWTTVLSLALSEANQDVGVYPKPILSYVPVDKKHHAYGLVSPLCKSIFGREITNNDRLVDFTALQTYDANHKYWIPKYVEELIEGGIFMEMHRTLLRIKAQEPPVVTLKENIKNFHIQNPKNVEVFKICLLNNDWKATHFCAIIVDHRTKKIFKLDPQDVQSPWGKTEIETFFSDYLADGYQTVTPSKIACPNFKVPVGFQAATGGFLCQTWSLYMTILIIMNPNIPIKQLYYQFSDPQYATDKIMKFMAYVYSILPEIELPAEFSISKGYNNPEHLGTLWGKLNPYEYAVYNKLNQIINAGQNQYDEKFAELQSFANQIQEELSEFIEKIPGENTDKDVNDLKQTLGLLKTHVQNSPVHANIYNIEAHDVHTWNDTSKTVKNILKNLFKSPNIQNNIEIFKIVDHTRDLYKQFAPMVNNLIKIGTQLIADEKQLEEFMQKQKIE